MARANTANSLADLNANLEYNVAGMNREERLTREGQQFQTGERVGQESWQSGENSLARQMAREQNQWAVDAASTANRRSQQAALWQLPGQLAGAAIGAYTGGLGAAAGRAALPRN